MNRHGDTAAVVHFRLPDGAIASATHGDIVGRMVTSAVQINDPAVSEAHALVTLRAGAFRLLALRGQLGVAGEVVRDVILSPGLEVYVTPTLAIQVAAVHLPEAVFAIEGPEIPRHALPASCAIMTAPSPRISSGYQHAAQAWIWTNGATWMLRIGTGPARSIVPGDSFTIGDHTFRTSLLAVGDAGGAQTERALIKAEPILIKTNHDIVQLSTAGRAPVTIAGKPARLICELASMGGTADWETLAAEIWPGAPRHTLRRRLDVTLTRLRDRLREVGVRPELVRPCGNGVFQLVLNEQDRLESP